MGHLEWHATGYSWRQLCEGDFHACCGTWSPPHHHHIACLLQVHESRDEVLLPAMQCLIILVHFAFDLDPLETIVTNVESRPDDFSLPVQFAARALHASLNTRQVP